MATLRSMTAYGRGTHIFDQGTFTIEVHSVNSRFLDTIFKLPRSLLSFEPALRSYLSSYVARGNLTIFVQYEQNPSDTLAIIPNLALVKGLQEAWKKIALTLEVESTLPLSILARQQDLFTQKEMVTDEGSYLDALKSTLDQAIKQLVQMKEQEGQFLAEDILKRLEVLSKMGKNIADNSIEATEVYRQKLIKRIESLLQNSVENDERLLKEVALFAEKVDVTEEIIRLTSHITQTKEVVLKPFQGVSESKGKTLDFLVQEMLREVNTIGSKVSDKDLIHLVVDMKGELEKIKEQARNIE